ncbi:MFS transporter [Embleya sp. NPDC001921]
MATTNAQAPAGPSRRWVALFFIGLAQLMLVLDATVVNIAMPSIQGDLGVSDADRQWIITAYTLAFGGLLLLGGRIADYVGRKRTFLIALLGFTAASALGGAAGNFEMLLVARAVQGAFGALLQPSALALLTVTFSQPKDRTKAFGIWGGISAAGGTIGLLAGGALTDYLDWRWCLYVNIPIALVAAIGGYMVLAESRRDGKARLDIPGVVLVTGGLVAIVYATTRAEADGWGSTTVLGLLTVGAALLAMFVFVESRMAQPLLPLRVVADRTRGGAYLAVGLAIIGMFGAFLFMTYYMQVVKGYSPTKTGAAFLPMAVAVLVSAAGLSTRLMPRFPPRALIVPGMLVNAVGMLWMITVDPDTSYAGGVLISQLLLGFGAGLVMPVAINYATHGVDQGDLGVASATVNTAQQIGGSLGTALLNTIATSATVDYLASHDSSPATAKQALVEGFAEAGAWAAGIIVVGALIVAALMNTARPEQLGAETGAAIPDETARFEGTEKNAALADDHGAKPLPAHT